MARGYTETAPKLRCIFRINLPRGREGQATCIHTALLINRQTYAGDRSAGNCFAFFLNPKIIRINRGEGLGRTVFEFFGFAFLSGGGMGERLTGGMCRGQLRLGFIDDMKLDLFWIRKN